MTKLPSKTLSSQTIIDVRLLLPAGLGWLLAVIILQSGITAGMISVLVLSVMCIAVYLLLFRAKGNIGKLLLVLGYCLMLSASTIWQLEYRHVPEVEETIAKVQEAVFILEIEAYCRVDPFSAGIGKNSAAGTSFRCPVWAQLQGSSSQFRAQVHFSDRSEAPYIGERMAVQARAQRILDPRAEAYRLSITEVMSTFEPHPVQNVLNPIRIALIEAAKVLPGSGGQLVPGVAIGDTSLVSDDLDEAMKSTSLSHLTAVSGSNFAMVVMALLFLGGMFGLSRVSRSIISLFGLLGFMLLVTAEPSVLRASVMAIIALIAMNSGRGGAPGAALALSVMLLLLLDPWLALQFGFILSVAATAGLVFLAPRLAEGLARYLPRPLALALSIPLAAQLACQPALLLLQEGIPSYGVIANLLVSVASPLSTGFGLLAGVLLPLLPALGYLLLWLAWLPAAWIAFLAEFFANMPGARMVWFEGHTGAIVATVCLIAFLFWLFSADSVSRTRIAQISGFLGLFVIVVISGYMTGERVLPRDWQLAFCDVGQGDAYLVRSAQQIALIDTGPDAKKLTECLGRLGVEKIDLLVITHFDHDHMGGLTALAQVPIHTVLFSAINHEQQQELAVLTQNERQLEAYGGQRGKLGNTDWRIHWPLPQHLRTNSNQSSVVISFQGEISFLALGDLGETSQLQLLSAQQLPKAVVVKVAHHGSADQSSLLYQQLNPQIAVFTVGENIYGHPHPKTLELVANSQIFRTDEHGIVLINFSDFQQGPGQTYVWTER